MFYTYNACGTPTSLRPLPHDEAAPLYLVSKTGVKSRNTYKVKPLQSNIHSLRD